MANDNNNIKAVVSEFDDESTTALELPSGARRASPDEAGPENEEHTSAVDAHGHDRASTLAELQSELNLRNERIARLQFDLELLRGRRLGLEEELRAREALTDDLHSELRQTRDELRSLAAQRSAWQAAMAALEQQLATTQPDGDTEATDAAADLAALQQQPAADADELQRLQGELADLRAASGAAEQAARAECIAAAVARQLHDASTELAAKDSALYRQDAELAERNRTIEMQSERLAALRAAVDSLQNASSFSTATPAGRPDDRAAEVFELQEQLGRTEHYADFLRRRLQDSDEARQQLRGEAAERQNQLDEARAEISRLAAMLEQERTGRVGSEQALAAVTEQRNDETRVLHCQLERACEDLAAQSASNERLTVLLAEVRGGYQQLEETAAAAAAAHAARCTEFRRTEAELTSRIAALEQELTARDEDIASLFNELAVRSGSNPKPPVADRGVDAASAAGDPGPGSGTGERCTRLLVGRVAGQALRFPLFKDRVTIGRLPKNDIQLPEACVSRLHAIIECAGDTCSIRDTGSKNGLYLNGTHVTRAQLQHGDQIIIGTAAFRFEERPRR